MTLNRWYGGKASKHIKLSGQPCERVISDKYWLDNTYLLRLEKDTQERTKEQSQRRCCPWYRAHAQCTLTLALAGGWPYTQIT